MGDFRATVAASELAIRRRFTAWRSRYPEVVTVDSGAAGSPDSPGAPASPASAPMPRNPGRHDLGMRATLVFPNREIVERYYVPLIYTACRTCYSELAPDDIFERAVDGRISLEKQRELIGRVIESGHGSTIEHVVFTFAISGVTRTLSHQLVRHRAGLAGQNVLLFVVEFHGDLEFRVNRQWPRNRARPCPISPFRRAGSRPEPPW